MALLALLPLMTAGAAPGVLTIQADAVLEETAFLEIEIVGSTPGTQFDQLQVEGELFIDGELRIVLQDNYFPDSQDAFGASLATGVNAPVRPTWKSIPSTTVSSSSAGNL